MDSSTEIRKLAPSNLRELSKILEIADSWKRLMAIIPTKLHKHDYKCDINMQNLPKYHSEHFRMIEKASINLRKTCTEILLDEWGTSGRIRPTLGHLLHLLIKVEIFRAADYVAINILRLETPERPLEGPAAHVLPHEIDLLEDSNNDNINAHVIPKIIISQTPSEEINQFSLPILQSDSNNASVVVSDMMKFSQTEADLPDLSILNVNQTDELPSFNQIMNDSSANIPAFSAIMSQNALSDSNNIPAFSVILNQDEAQTSNDNLSQSKSENNLIPAFDLIMSDDSKSGSLSILQNSSSNSSRPHCASPLPNLSLNTILPHYTYYELEKSTNQFDETPHQNTSDLQSTEANLGRFLGSGAFGAVYLALGLLDKPIAIKKLFLNDQVEVNIDDAITKQFRNEVEILCKYKHENLLDILGYSCDGPTYCLMYEYISGGALKERLERCNDQLQWLDRVAIATGTSEAVAYLHTALATPLIHRDIKTANILLDCANRAKLGDFGIIKLSPNQNTTISTTIIGTSVYMAPEAFRSGDVSVKTDTFSFGVVLLELLTALPPLDENREARDLISHVEDICEDNSISPILDKAAGSWQQNDINFGDEMFIIANKCLEEKKKRPNMVEIRDMLVLLVNKIR